VQFYCSHALALSPLQNSGPCNSFHCLGQFKNVYDDDDDDADGNQRIQIREKTLESSSAVLSTLSPYLNPLQHNTILTRATFTWSAGEPNLRRE